MFKSALLCLGLLLVSAPLCARADDAPATPAPPERFITVDGGFAGTTYNELASGASTTGFGVHAVAEVPVIGHNWAAQVDFRSYSYSHTAFGTSANGLSLNPCAAGDPGCVTPIGYHTYNSIFTPGPVNYINSYRAQDATTQITFGSKIAPIERYYVSVGYLVRGTNEPGYPVTSGMGFGLDKLPDVDRAFSVYGNFWVFFNVGGNYTGPSSPLLGTLSNYPFVVSSRVYTYRLGATFKIPSTPAFIDLSDAGDRADVTSAAPSDAQHNNLYVGLGLKF